MILKIIKVGSGAGVIIPKECLEEQGISVGDKVGIEIRSRVNKHPKLIIEYDAFAKQYGETLKNLND